MGKAKRKSFSASQQSALAGKPRKPASEPLPKLTDPEIQELRETRIFPHTKKLLSLEAPVRAEALAEIAESLDEPQVRNLFLREKIVQFALERGVHDDLPLVRVKAWGMLKAVAKEEGFDQCLYMFRQGVLVPMKEAVFKVGAGLLEGAGTYTEVEKNLAWEYIDNVLGVLLHLSETIDVVVDAIFETEGLVPFVVKVLGSSAPTFVKETAVKVLYTITVSDPGRPAPYIEDFLALSDSAPALLSTLHNYATDSPLLPIAAAGTIHNTVTEEQEILPDNETIKALLKNLEVAVTRMKESLRPSQNFDTAVAATEIALEVIASMAIAVQNDPDTEGLQALKEEAEDEDEAMDEDGDEEIGNDDEGDDEKEDGEGEEDSDDELPDELLADMDAVTAVDHAPSLPPQTEEYLRTLTLTIPPGLLSLLSSDDLPVSVRTRATNALANITWLFSDAIPPSSKLYADFTKIANTAWSEITSIMAANTADIELADAIASLAWALSKTAIPLDLSASQHRAFIALYNAAGTSNDDSLQTKCVGILGRLALGPNKIEINKEIGTFLMKLITELPNTPLRPGLGACDAIMDVYADIAFDYDEEVFWKCGFYAHLEKAIKGVRTAVKRIDKKNRKEERMEADEVVENLCRFVRYKKDEKKKAERVAEKKK